MIKLNQLSPRIKEEAGFTLLEVLLAIGITALIGVSTYTLLSQTLRTRDHLSSQAEQLREVQLASTLIQNDFRQIASRVIRDQFGDHQPSLRLGGYSQYGFVEFTRDGVSNPLKLKRSNYQRVSYELSDDQLIRHSWVVLDQAPDSTPREQVLLSGIVSAEVKVYSGDGWLTSWPQEEANPTPKTLSAMPKAISLEITTETDQVYRWIEKIPGGA